MYSTQKLSSLSHVFDRINGCHAGAPQNHWFGPAGDPRGAGIGTPEAIRLVWSCHREIIHDNGPIPEGTALTQT